jgi:hypothetical protein
MAYTRKLVCEIAETPAVANVLALYEEGQDLGLSAALALETARINTRPWDVEAFATAGRAAAARQRNEGEKGCP